MLYHDIIVNMKSYLIIYWSLLVVGWASPIQPDYTTLNIMSVLAKLWEEFTESYLTVKIDSEDEYQNGLENKTKLKRHRIIQTKFKVLDGKIRLLK